MIYSFVLCASFLCLLFYMLCLIVGCDVSQFWLSQFSISLSVVLRWLPIAQLNLNTVLRLFPIELVLEDIFTLFIANLHAALNVVNVLEGLYQLACSHMEMQEDKTRQDKTRQVE